VTGLYVGAGVRELVPGSPGDLDRLAARSRTVATGLGGAAARVRAVDAGEWVGPAGDAFRAVVDVEPAKYEDAAAAFAATSSAVRSYAGVLRDAQSTARAAISLYEQAAQATASWRDSVDRYDAAVRDAAAADDPAKVVNGLRRPSAYDPGTDDRAHAESLLADAQARVAEAGRGAARRIAAAWERAPREPHWWEKAGHFVAEIGRGAWEATTGLVEFAWQVSTVRMLVDPVGWTKDMTALGEGLVFGLTHPVELAKVLVDWDTWQESPGRAVGHLLPDLLLTLATAGGGAAARAAHGAEAIDDIADVGTTFQRLDRLGESGDRLRYLQRARHLLSGEHLPEPNLGRHSPAGLAAGWQSTPAYPNADRWFNAVLPKEETFGAGSLSFRHEMPFGNFTVPQSVVDEVGTDARRLYEGVQVKPFEGTYRDELTVLRAKEDIPVAVSYALRNPQYGAGGLRQMYVHNLQQLIDDGVVEIVVRNPMDNIVSRTGAALADR
jgi:hypothetical protein